MTDPLPFEAQAESLKLRSDPKPVTRINRKVVVAGAGVGAMLLLIAASVALDPPSFGDDEERKELYNTTNKPTADALASLPASYSDMPSNIPVLGPPNEGELGATIVQTERELGIMPETVPYPVTDFRPNAEEEAARAERLRLAQLARKSAEAPVFFQLQNRPSRIAAANLSQDAILAGADASPFSALSLADDAAGPIDPNLQDSKSDFANSRNNEIYNPHDLETPRSPHQVMAGTIIPASLITGLNSDLPGSIIAQITQGVYDTVTGRTLLIPQGARLIGRYDARVSFGQRRALVVWDRIIMPDGSSILIDALPGADARGFAGLRDRVDNHYGRLFLAAGLATLLEIGSELSFSDDDGNIAEAIQDSFQDSANQAGQRVVDRNLNIQPTLKVRPGWPLRVIVTRDLILRPYQQATYK